MANPESPDAVRRARRRKRPEIGSDGQPYRLRGDIEDSQMPTLEELRNLRADRYSGGSTRRRTVPPSRMVTSSISRSSLSHAKSSSRHRHKSTHVHRSETETSSRRKSRAIPSDEELSHIYVYGPPRARKRSSVVKISERERLGSESDSDEKAVVMSVVSEESEMEPETEHKTRKVKAVYVRTDGSRPSRHHTTRRVIAEPGRTVKEVRGSTKSLNRSHTTSTRRNSNIQPLDILRRTLSAKDVRESRPILRRSHTISDSNLTTKPAAESSVTTTKNMSKRSSFFGLFAQPKDEKPTRLVECLTCLSDDVPIYKSAKLKCGHRMCHSCLKRIFKLSVNDPQHMPPKCCTADHIPLKHVDRLFDTQFKILWNKKFQEYTTKNRIYCPARRCGEWIRPGSIHSEGGKKFGKCSRCKTKVCFLCNGKWHGNKDCPKDEETNAILEAAKQAGWQRCYNCRTMVELREGCNHMTCRCRAEFCMICGLKWKGCNCPWFNYEAVENDRLNHMRIPGDRNPDDIIIVGGPAPLQRPLRLRAYRDELQARRRQELLDEELARRLRVLGIDDDDDYNRRAGNIDGVGNARGQLVNDDYRRPALNPRPNLANAAANYVMEIQRAQGIPRPPSPPLRAAERLVPRRTGMDYAAETGRHLPTVASAPPPVRHIRPSRPAPRPSVLAGLGGSGRGSGRVGAWRNHVEPGVVPDEGVLSM